MQNLIKEMEKRNISAFTVKNRKDALAKALSMIPKSSTIGFGGSTTLEEIGILDLLRNKKDIILLDRTKVTPEKTAELYSKIFSCDIFLSSANAITEKGQIVNVDGRGNRVAAITYGPKKVIIIAGKNKVTKDVDSALDRIKKVACPKNLERMKSIGNTSWNKENIWGQISIIEHQQEKGRMNVILVDEELGY